MCLSIPPPPPFSIRLICLALLTHEFSLSLKSILSVEIFQESKVHVSQRILHFITAVL